MLSKLALSSSVSDSKLSIQPLKHIFWDIIVVMNLLQIRQNYSTLKTDKNLKTLKSLPVYNSNIKVDLTLYTSH